MNKLSHKKVLLFSVTLFNYHNLVKESMEKMGAVVHMYDERNNPSTLDKVLIRKANFLLKRKTLNYYRDVAEKESSFNPDYVGFCCK